MVKVKEIVPTDTFRLIAKKLGKSDLEDLIKHGEEEIEDEVNALDVNEDQAFEFMDIFDKCKEHIADGYEIQFKTHGVIEKDEIVSFPVGSGLVEPCLPGRMAAPLPMEKPKPPMPVDEKLSMKNLNLKESKTGELTFGEIVEMISPEGREKLKKENLLHVSVLARIANADYEQLGLSDQDLKIVRDMVIQCRYQMVKRMKEPLSNTIKNHQIYKKMPFTNEATFRALDKAGIKSGNQLYLFTSVDQIYEILESDSNIPDEDQRAIIGGVGMAKYARTILRHNNRNNRRNNRLRKPNTKSKSKS
jgi:hypothetical protein